MNVPPSIGSGYSKGCPALLRCDLSACSLSAAVHIVQCSSLMGPGEPSGPTSSFYRRGNSGTGLLKVTQGEEEPDSGPEYQDYWSGAQRASARWKVAHPTPASPVALKRRGVGRAVLIPLSVPLLTHHEVWKLPLELGLLQGLLWRRHLSKLRAFQALPESRLESAASCPRPSAHAHAIPWPWTSQGPGG